MYLEILEDVTKKGLQGLIELGFIDGKVIGQFICRSNQAYDKILDAKFFDGAVTEHDNGNLILIISTKHKGDRLLKIISHEVIHLAQFFKGDYRPKQGFTIWKGKKYESLNGAHPNYFDYEHQPWEAEAKYYEDNVYKHLSSEGVLNSMEKIILKIRT